LNAPKNTPASRRRFLKSAASGVVAGGALATFGIPAAAAGAAREFKIGVIGCGGRGTGAANNAREAAKLNGDTVTIHAVADAFNDRAERARRTNKVPKERTFVGIDAYHKLLALDLDYVILATPPYFRPQMIDAAVKAGKNIFTEKPVGVDAPGIRRVLAAGESAKTKGLSIAAGTQRRHQKQYIECQKRVAGGDIGQVVTARCYWNQGGLWSRAKDPNWTDMEWQIRNWLYFTWLSGDHIVEQHVHNLDVTNWFMGSHPIRVRGMGGRQVRTGKAKYGNIFDHFATELIYKNPLGSGYPDIRATSMCRQIVSCWNDVSEFVVGTEGSTNCRSQIFGPKAWKWSGKQVNAYVQEHIDLQASIKEGEGKLNEAENVAHSTFTAILSRTSNYTGKELHWDKELKEGATWGPQEFDLNTPIEIPPVPQVGKPM
jgi:predicted dehydrogenase